ncbi:unnamed protein product [Chilo suppressalis]|uniref:Tetraspanin n=1 Tax=Chilo suppressalis TaxID=168631 RepID=A0ABN8ASQ3_CHISP|nr:unnamed protein product [Chilo suppressalis]
MGCLSVLIKIFLFIVNFVAVILGLLIVAAGALLIHFSHLIQSDVTIIVAISAIVFGTVLFFIAFCGCCGSIGDIKCFLILYGIFIFLLAAVNIFLIVILLLNRDTLETTVTNTLDDIFKDSGTRETFYFIEYLFGCCGTTGGQSYELIGQTIPPTCCQNNDFPSINDIADIENIINNQNGTAEFCAVEETYSGCTPYLIDILTTISNVFTYILIAVVVTQVLVVVSAFYLVSRIKKYRGKVY